MYKADWRAVNGLVRSMTFLVRTDQDGPIQSSTRVIHLAVRQDK